MSKHIWSGYRLAKCGLRLKEYQIVFGAGYSVILHGKGRAEGEFFLQFLESRNIPNAEKRHLAREKTFGNCFIIISMHAKATKNLRTG